MSRESTPEGSAQLAEIIANNKAKGMIVSPDTPLSQCPCSFDVTTPAGKAKAINALGDGDIIVTHDEPGLIRATDWLVLPGEKTNEETGEIEHFAWLVLFDADGKTLKTTSSVVPKRIKQMLDLYGREEWNKGINVMVVSKIARTTKRMYHDIKIIPD